MGVTTVTISCDNCKKEFKKIKKDIKNKHVFCSKECENEYRHKQTHEIRKCEFCGEEFECSKKSTKKFCSRECVGKWQSTQLGNDNPRFKQKEICCEWCNKKYYTKQSKVNNGQHKFCSTKCRQKWFGNEYSQRESTKLASQKRAITML
ncbi:MAG TPA: hypothetical protein DCW51_07400, partial [Clostridium sp.]|nr:hypothetical protein [Clostridium sp.]